MDDSKLIRLIRRNPEKGLREAIDQYGAFVKAISRKIMGNCSREDMDECISDVFVKLWKSSGSFDPDKGNLRTLIGTIARNTAIDYYRRGRTQEEEAGDELPDAFCLPETIEQQIEEEQVREAVGQLGEPEREFYTRRYFQGQPVKEIAEQTGYPPKFVENKLYRTKPQLARLLKERGISQ